MLPELVPQETIRSHIRVTPQGVFVQESCVPTVVEAYRTFLTAQSGGAVSKSDRKCIKRLFGTEEPTRYYLIEGSQSMLGNLIVHEIAQPQQFGMPFYLGSLQATSDYLHPRDPMFVSLPHVTARAHQGGLEVAVTSKGKDLRFTTEFTKNFCALVSRSSRLREEFPEASNSLRDGLKALIEILPKARPAAKSDFLLIPQSITKSSRALFLRRGKLIVAANAQRELVACYELHGANFVRFVREEFAHWHREQRNRPVGAFVLSPPRARTLGEFVIGKQKTPLAARAFKDYVSSLMNAPRGAPAKKAPAKKSRITVQEALADFSELFQRADEIAYQRIATHVPTNPARGTTFRVNREWIFQVNGRRGIERVYDRRGRTAVRR